MKFSKYNFIVEKGDNIIIYNTATSEYAEIDDNETKEKFYKLQKAKKLSCNDELVKALYDRRYIVDDDVDEYKEAKKVVRKLLKYKESELELLIYTTEKCNFRCVYCPQKHQPKDLSVKHWESLYKYIEKNVVNKKYKKLHIGFFGGEPMLKTKHIIKFCSKIKKLNENYPKLRVAYYITTNGYLLTPQIYDTFTELGFNYYQITLDGFAKTHNKTRMLVNGGGTWDKIVENLKYINTKKDNVYVCIRTNINSNNFSEIEKYCDWLNNTFDNPKMLFDLNPVTKFSENVKDEYLTDIKKETLDDMIKKYNRYTIDPNESISLLGGMCRCARKSYYTITADGKIVKCEKASDNNYKSIGELSDNGDFVFNKDYTKWIRNFEFDRCKDCIYYPICAARACPLKKIENLKSRIDCYLKTDDVNKLLNHIIKNDYLKKIPIK